MSRLEHPLSLNIKKKKIILMTTHYFFISSFRNTIIVFDDLLIWIFIIIINSHFRFFFGQRFSIKNNITFQLLIPLNDDLLFVNTTFLHIKKRPCDRPSVRFACLPSKPLLKRRVAVFNKNRTKLANVLTSPTGCFSRGGPQSSWRPLEQDGK